MKEFALIFRMDITTVTNQPSREQMEIYMQQWWKWIDFISAKNQLSNGGNHFSKKGKVLNSNKTIIESPYIADNNSIAGYIIILSESLDKATEIALKCPILEGKNTSVEIREIESPNN